MYDRSFFDALLERKAVFWALLNLEMTTKFGDSYFGYAWLITEPLLFLLVTAALFAIMGRSPSDMPILLFLLTGIVPFFYFRKAVQSSTNAIRANAALFSFRQVKVFDAVFTRILFEACIYIVVAIIFTCMILYLDEGMNVYHPLRLMLMLICLSFISLGLGLAFCIIAYYYLDFDKFTGIVFRFMFLISGILFSLQEMPKQIAYYLSFNPVLQIIEYIRSCFYEHKRLSIYLSYEYVLSSAIIILFFGVLTYFVSRKNILKNDRSR